MIEIRLTHMKEMPMMHPHTVKKHASSKTRKTNMKRSRPNLIHRLLRLAPQVLQKTLKHCRNNNLSHPCARAANNLSPQQAPRRNKTSSCGGVASSILNHFNSGTDQDEKCFFDIETTKAKLCGTAELTQLFLRDGKRTAFGISFRTLRSGCA